jgi:hypothetical protein
MPAANHAPRTPVVRFMLRIRSSGVSQVLGKGKGLSIPSILKSPLSSSGTPGDVKL